MSSDWEEVVGEIEGKLLTLLASDLNDICAALNVDVEESEKDSARVLRRRILQYLEGDDVTSLEDAGMSVLLDLNDKIDDVKRQITKHSEPVPQVTATAVRVQQVEQATAVQQTVQELHLVDEVDIAASNAVAQGESVFDKSATKTSPIATQHSSLVHPLYRRDLKIIGQIGEPNQTDK